MKTPNNDHQSFWTGLFARLQNPFGKDHSSQSFPEEAPQHTVMDSADFPSEHAFLPFENADRNVAGDPLHKLLAFDLLFDRMRQAYKIEDSLFEQQGEMDGKKLGDPKLGKAQIEHIFKAGQLKEEALASLFEAKIEAATQRKTELQNDIKILKRDLDEMDPKSKVYKINQRILNYQEKLRTGYEEFFQKKPENECLQDIFENRIDKELEQAGRQQKQQEMLFEELTSQFSIVAEELKRNLQDQTLSNSTPHKPDEKDAEETDGQPIKTSNKEINSYMEKARESMATLHDLYESSRESLKIQNEDLRAWYKGMQEEVRKDIPSVPSRFYILTMGIFLVIVLLGEIYLINEMTSRIFGVNPDGNGAGILPDEFYIITHLLFCIAYPISIGMAVKYFLVQLRAQDRKPYRFVRNLLRVAALLIICVAALNVFAKESVIAALETLYQDSEQELFLIPINIGAFLGISFVFSFVSGFMFLDFFDAHKLYVEKWEASPFEAKPDQTKDQKYFEKYQKGFKKAIKALKEEKTFMVKELKEKQAALHKQEADISRLPKEWNFKEILDNLKQAAIAAYFRGYQKGRIERQDELGYEGLIDSYRKSQITQNYPSPLMNGSSN